MAVSHRLWVPAGNTGSVDVIDAATDKIKQVEGFAVAQVKLRGKTRPVGPSSVAIGDGAVYIGNRADSKICTIDARTLKLGDCVAFAASSAGMAAAPDGRIYIAATHELWATPARPNATRQNMCKFKNHQLLPPLSFDAAVQSRQGPISN